MPISPSTATRYLVEYTPVVAGKYYPVVTFDGAEISTDMGGGVTVLPANASAVWSSFDSDLVRTHCARPVVASFRLDAVGNTLLLLLFSQTSSSLVSSACGHSTHQKSPKEHRKRNVRVYPHSRQVTTCCVPHGMLLFYNVGREKNTKGNKQ